MISLAEIVSGLYGAWRLLCLDDRGLGYFNNTLEGFWRSFYAAVLVAPLMAVYLAVRYGGMDSGISIFRFAAIETVQYVMLWVAFPLAMVGIARAIDRSRNYVVYIVAYNWATVWQNLVFLPGIVLISTGVIGGPAGQFLSYALVAAVLAYVWVVTRFALGVGGGMAAMLVLVDLALSFVINSVGEALIRLG